MDLQLINVSFSFPVRGGKAPVFRDLSLAFPAGTITTVIGRNGTGKSTLLQLAAGLLSPDTGRVETTSVAGAKHRIVSFVWQDYRDALLPWLSAADNVGFPVRLATRDRRVARRRGAELLDLLAPDIPPMSRPRQLSGGQQQKLAILRSLSVAADLYAYDEPFTAIDRYARWTFASQLEGHWKRSNAPVIVVTHDADEAVLLADRIVLMPGSTGSRPQILTNSLPRPRTAEMLTTQQHLELRAAVLSYLHRPGLEKAVA